MTDSRGPVLALFYCQNTPNSIEKERQFLEEKYGKLSQQEKISKLEETLKRGSQIYTCLDEEKKKNLGYLTTYYAKQIHDQEDGILQIETLDFLQKYKIDYKLLGLHNANIVHIEYHGKYVLKDAQNVHIGS